MLVRFNIGNFLSFKEIQEFSMIIGKPESKSERVIEADKLKLLKFAAIFGANASGKSNLISAIKFAQTAIINGIPKKGQALYFKIDSAYASKPSYFEFEILLDNHIYAYGFEVYPEKNQIVSEWLIQLSPTGNDKIIFSRDVSNGIFQSDLEITSKALRNKFEVYSDDCKSNPEIFFLNEMNRAKADLYKEKNELYILKQVYDWFVTRLDINYINRPVSNYSYFKDVKDKEEVCRVIGSLGTGITNYEERKISLMQLQQQLPKEQCDILEDDIKEWKNRKLKNNKESSLSVRVNDMYYIISLDENKPDNIEVSTIIFNHGSDTVFELSDESEGTRRILDLIEILFTGEDKIFVIDELDRSLHPQLTCRFIQEFLAVAQRRNIQLIITTHESRLLDFKLLRQDELWIAEKLKSGETKLYSLDEYNITFERDVDKAYLEGRYGGVPILDTIFPAKKNKP